MYCGYLEYKERKEYKKINQGNMTNRELFNDVFFNATDGHFIFGLFFGIFNPLTIVIFFIYLACKQLANSAFRLIEHFEDKEVVDE